jgi:hypothetical protein
VIHRSCRRVNGQRESASRDAGESRNALTGPPQDKVVFSKFFDPEPREEDETYERYVSGYICEEVSWVVNRTQPRTGFLRGLLR